MSQSTNLTELQAIIQDIEDCGATRKEAKQIVADTLDRSFSRVEGWLSVGQLTPIPDPLLKLLKLKLEGKQ